MSFSNEVKNLALGFIFQEALQYSSLILEMTQLYGVMHVPRLNAETSH